MKDCRCPICQMPVTALHVFNAPPAAEEIAEAWEKLGRPAQMDLSNELFVHQANIVWPDPESLPDEHPIVGLLGMQIRAHEGAGYWMRPATVEYARMQCTICGVKMSRAVPKDAIPVGAVLRCAKCEIENQERYSPALKPGDAAEFWSGGPGPDLHVVLVLSVDGGTARVVEYYGSKPLMVERSLQELKPASEENLNAGVRFSDGTRTTVRAQIEALRHQFFGASAPEPKSPDIGPEGDAS